VETGNSETAAPAVTRQVGLCGLGNMGSAIASRLAPRFRLLGYDTDQARAARAAKEYGFQSCAGLTDLAAAESVVLCLPSPSASVAVVESMAPRMPPGGVIIETSTVGPETMHRLGAICLPHGIGVIDAAIAAGVGQMRSGTAALIVGGDGADVDKAAPVLDALAAKTVRLGALGSGAALKVINNAVAHAVMVVLVEAAAMAEACGVPRGRFIDLLTGNDAGLTRPLEHRLMERVARGDYDGGMPTEAALKDSKLALALAQQNGIPIFAIQASHTVYEMAAAQQQGRLDYASIAMLWERWLGRSLADPGSAAP
jgi:3-hydroxyisobutyrate dehydrogenase-like beta-hydroxyacid dehydrogenase